ncbi:hypothetical protein GPECTOR_21g695 [Gonium pectorale]|uniref:Nucleolar pre-ribosomal-associated protein 1 N-terminal domain-containing protein n=1 Tax=Gonium pectorale TaxID=33097 RepID=A0A150GI52_GONPE|nr:hypothetical protein GPECTOR_21g695 [Gonium pectorale]|eukprot:KXZ49469.1 hypothetical protein GPECTOR_21g695 [Gonium pectorale]
MPAHSAAPAAVRAELDVGKTIEALRATREFEVNLSGLKTLREAIKQPGPRGRANLLAYLRASPACVELTNIWDVQSNLKEPRILPQLLLLLSDLLSVKPTPSQPPAVAAPPEPPSTSGRRGGAGADARTHTAAGGAGGPSEAADAALVSAVQQLVITQALGRRLKSLYNALSSDSGQSANAALQLLVSVASHSAVAARDLAAAFDWSLSALTRLCRPQKEKRADDGKQRRRTDGDAAPSPAAASWRHPNVLSRPRRALFVALCRALLASADHATLARLLPLRPLMGGLLHHLATDPPGQALETLLLLARRVLAPPASSAAGPAGRAGGGGGGLPPRLRAEPWGDTALAQLAELAAASDQPVAGGEAGHAGAATEPGAQFALAAEAALEALVALCTDPANGLVTPSAVAASGGGAAAAAAGALQYGPGVKRLLRLLPRLRPLERPRHARLLGAVAELRPWLAAEFASSLPYDLQPRVGTRWVAAMTLAARLTAATAAAPMPLLERLAAAAGSGGGPPAFESALVRAHLRCCLPPALSKPVLSRGIQHGRPVVRALTLDALLACLRSLEPLMAAARAGRAAAAAAAAASSGSAGAGDAAAAAAWAAFYRRLSSAVRARLPEVQTLLSLHAALEREAGAPASGVAAAAQAGEAPGAAASGTQPAAALGRGGSAKGPGDSKARGAQALGQGDDGEEAGEAGEEEEAEEAEEEEEEAGAGTAAGSGQGGGERAAASAAATAAELAAAVFGASVASDAASVRRAVAVRLLDALAAYRGLRLEAGAEAQFDPLKLLPQARPGGPPEGSVKTDVLALTEVHQMALLRVLVADEEAAGDGAGSGGPAAAAAAAATAAPLSTALVAPLLRLLTRSASPAVRRAAGELLVRRARAVLVGSGAPAAAVPGAHAGPLGGPCPPPDGPAASSAGSSWGLDELELRVWLWLLPAMPPCVAASSAAESEDGAAAAGGRLLDAPSSFLADVLVGASRRPQDGYELMQAWAPPAVTAVDGPKLDATITITLPHEGRPLVSLHAWLLRTCAKQAEALAAAAPPGATEHTRLRAGNGGPADEPPSKRRRKSAAPAEAAAARRQELRLAALPWGVGVLQLALGEGPDALQQQQKELSKQLRTIVKAAAKAARASAKASRRESEADGGAGQDGDVAIAGDGDGRASTTTRDAALEAVGRAVSAAAQLLSQRCAEAGDAAAQAVRLLQAPARRAHNPTEAGPEGGAAKGGPTAVLLAALWVYALAKPLASHCIGPAELIILGQRAGAADDEDGAAEGPATPADGSERPEAGRLAALLPSPAALAEAVGGGAGGDAVGWDGGLMELLLLQSAFLRGRAHPGPGPAAARGEVSCSGRVPAVPGTLAAAATRAAQPPAMAAAARSAVFWLPLLRSPAAVDEAFALVRMLLPQPPRPPQPAAVACGALCHFLSSPALLSLLAPEQLSAHGQETAGRGREASAAAADHSVRLVVDVMRLVEAEGSAGALELAWGAAAAAAVRRACRLHVTAAARSLRAVLRSDGAANGSAAIGGDSDGAGAGGAAGSQALARLLPLLRCADARLMLPLAEQALAAAAAATASGGVGRQAPQKEVKRRKSSASTPQPGGGRHRPDHDHASGSGWLLRLSNSLAAALLADPRPLLGGASGYQSRLHLNLNLRLSPDQEPAELADAANGSERESLLVTGAEAGVAAAASVRGRVLLVFDGVQKALLRLLPPDAGASAAVGDAEQWAHAVATAEPAAAALHAGLCGPAGHLLALGTSGDALAACVRLAPHSAAAAAAAAAALRLGPPSLLARFAATLPDAVASAERRQPGAGRRVALARLLPAADAFVRFAEARAGAGPAAGVVAASGDPDLAAVARTFKDPLLAYATRKRRRGAADDGRGGGDASDGFPGDALRLLRRHAVPVLVRLLRLAAAPGAGGAGVGAEGPVGLLRSLLPKLLPANGGRLLAAASACLDGCLGDLLADAPDSLRAGPAFAAVVRSAQPLAAATAAHAAGDPTALRCLRRLLAAMLPQAVGTAGEVGGEEEAEVEEEAGGEKDEGGAKVADATAEGLVDGDVSSGSEEGEEEGEGEEELPPGAEREEAMSGSEATEGSGEGSSEDDVEGEASDGGSPDATEDGASGDEMEADEDGDPGAEEPEGESESESLRSGNEGSEDAPESDSASQASGDVGEVEGAATAAAGDGDVEMEDADGAAPLLVCGVVPNAVAAAAAGAMLERVITSEALPRVFAPLAEADLPPALARLPLPLVSLLSLGDATEAAQAPVAPSACGSSTMEDEVEGPASAAASDAAEAASAGPGTARQEAARRELATLLETLVDLRLAFDPHGAAGGATRQGAGGEAPADSDVESDSDAAMEDGSGGGGGRPFGHAAAERSVLGALLQLLQCAYGASLRGSDRALLRVLLRLDCILCAAEAAEEDEGGDGGGGGATAAVATAAGLVGLRLSGPLARSGFLWGPAAALLAHVRNAVGSPLQQFPHLAALAAAEAAVVLSQPQAPMHKPITRLVGRKPALDLASPALFNRVLAAGAPGQRHEQTWALQLLRYGVMGPQDASICRRRFAAEVCMALCGSRAAAVDAAAGAAAGKAGDGGGGGGGAVPLALAVVASMARQPSLGRHLVLHAGVVPWLAQLVASSVREAAQGGGARGAGAARASAAPPPAAAAAVAALQDLAVRRVSLRRQDGYAGVPQYTAAASVLTATAATHNAAWLASAACRFLATVAAALPPWRAQPLWRTAASPEVLLRLRSAMVAASPPPGSRRSTSPAAALGPWLQAVMRSTFPAPRPHALAGGGSCGAAPGAAPGPSPPWDSGVPALVQAAIHSALALSHRGPAATDGDEPIGGGASSRGGDSIAAGIAALGPPAAGPFPARGDSPAPARACLVWLASLAAAGHPLSPPAAGRDASAPDAAAGAAGETAEALCRLAAVALQEIADGHGGERGVVPEGSGGGGDDGGPRTRLLLRAHAECQRSLWQPLGCWEAAAEEAQAPAETALGCAVASVQVKGSVHTSSCASAPWRGDALGASDVAVPSAPKRHAAGQSLAAAWLRAADAALAEAAGGPAAEQVAGRWLAAEAALQEVAGGGGV